MEQIDAHVAKKGMFMTTSTKSAVHLGKDREENLRVKKSTRFSELRTLFSITQKLIFEPEEELFGVKTVDWDQSPWMKSKYLGAQCFYQVAHSKGVRLFRFSALSERKVSTRSWRLHKRGKAKPSVLWTPISIMS